MDWRHRLTELPDGSTAVTKDLPGRIEITVDDGGDDAEITEADHDQLAAEMAHGKPISAKSLKQVKAKHDANA